MNIFIMWLVMVIGWNFGYPDVRPLQDVLVSIILLLFNIILKKILKINYSAEK